jgi:hypothetical protein
MLKQLIVILAVTSIVSSENVLESLLGGKVSINLEFDLDFDFTNPTHYGNPSGGCMTDELSGQIKGLDGECCFPKCDASGSCSTDYPSGTTAKGECILQGSDGTKFCVLVCSGMDTGNCPTGAKCQPI